MTIDQRLRDAAQDARRAVAGRRIPLSGVGAPRSGGRRVVAVATVFGLGLVLAATSYLTRSDPGAFPVGDSEPVGAVSTVVETTATVAPTTTLTSEAPSTTVPASDAVQLPTPPFDSPDLGLVLDPYNPDSGLPFEPFIENARTGVVPVELHGDILVVYEATADVIDLVPVRYRHISAISPGEGVPKARTEMGYFLILGERDVLFYIFSDDLPNQDPWAGAEFEEWGPYRVNVWMPLPGEHPTASFGVSLHDGSVWTKRISVYFSSLDRLTSLPLSEEAMRHVARLVFDALAAPAQ